MTTLALKGEDEAKCANLSKCRPFAYHKPTESSFGAAWESLQEHKALRKTTVTDDAILPVVVGQRPHLHDYQDAAPPNFRHKVGKVREWGAECKTTQPIISDLFVLTYCPSARIPPSQS